MSDEKAISNVVTKEQLPAFMQQEDVMGTEQLGDYVRPPRLKVVQATSKPPFDEYLPGTILVVPQRIKFAEFSLENKLGDIWKYVPIFFYPEWVQTSPIEVKGTEPFIRDRSLDPRSDLAKKARNKETWFEPHPERPDLQVANREHLNFVIMPIGHPLGQLMCVVTFAKATFVDGSNLAGLIKLRQAPVFGQVFEARVSIHSNAKGKWHAIDSEIPAVGPLVENKEEYEMYRALHLEMRSAHEKGALEVDYEDVPLDEGEANVDPEKTEF